MMHACYPFDASFVHVFICACQYSVLVVHSCICSRTILFVRTSIVSLLHVLCCSCVRCLLSARSCTHSFPSALLPKCHPLVHTLAHVCRVWQSMLLTLRVGCTDVHKNLPRAWVHEFTPSLASSCMACMYGRATAVVKPLKG